MLHQIRPKNILSFGPKTSPLELEPLNLFIGTNGSGKSNLVEVIDLIRSSPRELIVPVREGGGIRDWLWKGCDTEATAVTAEIELVIELSHRQPLRHRLAFTAVGGRFEVSDERIENQDVAPGNSKPYFYFGYEKGRPMLNTSDGHSRRLERADIHPERSILAQRRDPDSYPEITSLADFYDNIRLYRDWSFGRDTDARRGQSAELPSNFLSEDASNMALVLSTLRRKPQAKRAIVDDLRQLYDGIDDYEVIIDGGKAQLYLNERGRMIPATRLSDGTLRYLCLLTILHHPEPPALVAIEEPELGLHPDILPRLAELLKEAAGRVQLLVTTHSDSLVDSLSDTPDAVVVTEKHEGATSFERLDSEDLGVWLTKYSLGKLWTRGDIGGTRW